MLTLKPITSNDDKPLFYKELAHSLENLLGNEKNSIANMANMASLLYFSLPNINWSGFYLFDGNELVLGPFHGKPACIRIPIGRGVCGTSAEKRETVIVKNVHEFPGHIACDADSNSEIVLPIVIDGQLFGVLDIDSPMLNRFDEEDSHGLEALIRMFMNAIYP